MSEGEKAAMDKKLPAMSARQQLQAVESKKGTKLGLPAV